VAAYIGSSATLVSCVFQGNSAYKGGGMIVYGATATLYGCTFTSNTATSSGPDILNSSSDGGTVSVNGCAAGYYGGTQGTSLRTFGPSISGTTNSFSGCTECAR